MELFTTSPPPEAVRAAALADQRAAVAEHLKSIDRVNRLVWAAGSLTEFDAAVEASTTINDAEAGIAHAVATHAGLIRVERVGFKGGRKALVFAVNATGHEFVRNHGRTTQIAKAA